MDQFKSARDRTMIMACVSCVLCSTVNSDLNVHNGLSTVFRCLRLRLNFVYNYYVTFLGIIYGQIFQE